MSTFQRALNAKPGPGKQTGIKPSFSQHRSSVGQMFFSERCASPVDQNRFHSLPIDDMGLTQ